METLISMFSALIDFFHSVKSFFTDLVKPLSGIWNMETLIVVIMLLVAVAGIAANGLWKRRKPGELPWD
ncbi:MAG: hypothetical protein ACKVY0_20455 [Prosthecobacter sp.]|uniref:hypothetical protein n=1 Tax=Prosthecobacter sp. TaxID=1965333 RepID=UPI0038FE5397